MFQRVASPNPRVQEHNTRHDQVLAYMQRWNDFNSRYVFVLENYSGEDVGPPARLYAPPEDSGPLSGPLGVEFDQVWFGYAPDAPVLRGVSLRTMRMPWRQILTFKTRFSQLKCTVLMLDDHSSRGQDADYTDADIVYRVPDAYGNRFSYVVMQRLTDRESFSGFAGALDGSLRKGHMLMASDVACAGKEPLSVGLKMNADTPGLHVGRLLTTDKLIVRFDPYHNHIDDAWFEVNPAGVRGDQFNGDASWDPIWEAATHRDADGWTAEMRIPFSQLRFSPDSLQTWGLQIQRYVDSNNEQDMWAFRPRGEASGPSFYGHLAGLEIGKQPRQIEMLPYVVTGSRFDRAPDGDPYSDGHEMRLGMGADLKVLLTPNLTLDATINPDFGQVEVDPASLNLSAFETFYDEKRPFFVAGRGAFGFGGMRCMFCSNTSGLSAFYSRRIGRPPQLQGIVDDGATYAEAPDNTSILAAAKITGRTEGGYTIGVLDAVTGRETADYLPAPDAEEASQVVEPLTNYFVGRVEKELRGGATTFGGILTSVARRTNDALVSEHLRSHAEAGGVDWYHTWAGRGYSWMGSLLVSNVGGSAGAIARTQESSARYFHRPDRTATSDGLFDIAYDPAATSLRGYGLFTRVGKETGVFRWEAMSNVRSPGFEVNDLAFLHRTDYLWLNGNIGGQAVIEGVMMRSLTGYSVAVRQPDGGVAAPAPRDPPAAGAPGLRGARA